MFVLSETALACMRIRVETEQKILALFAVPADTLGVPGQRLVVKL